MICSCGVVLPDNYRLNTLRCVCGKKVTLRNPCPHLGPAIKRDGVVVKVKCNCTKEAQDRMLPAHECSKFGRCLPTARFNEEELKAWEKRDEAKLYELCQPCPLRSSATINE